MWTIFACVMSTIATYIACRSRYVMHVELRDEKIERLQKQITAFHHERARLLAPPVCERQHVEPISYPENNRPTITEILHLEN